MALHTDTEIYKATYALCQLVTQLVAGMPRNYKADFGADLRKACMTLVRRTYQANTAEDKTPILQRMREEIEVVNLSLRMAVDLKLISIRQYGRTIAITDSIGKQATGWQKHSERALAAGLSRQSGQRAMESGRTAGPHAHRQAQQGYQRRPPQ